ncbi:MAG: hypothetical protein QM765_08500 [Myxococcales bacterium]
MTARAFTLSWRPFGERATTSGPAPPAATRSTVACVYTIAPAFSAAGRSEISAERLAPVGQPKQQVPWPSQSGALRGSGPCAMPSASAPRAMIRAGSPRAGCLASWTSSQASTVLNQGSSSWGLIGAPCRRAQSARAQGGARRQVPELMTVVPPTASAVGSRMLTLPSVDCIPNAEYIGAERTMTDPTKSGRR